MYAIGFATVIETPEYGGSGGFGETQDFYSIPVATQEEKLLVYVNIPGPAGTGDDADALRCSRITDVKYFQARG